MRFFQLVLLGVALAFAPLSAHAQSLDAPAVNANNYMDFAGSKNNPNKGVKMVPIANHCHDMWQRIIKMGFTNTPQPGMVTNAAGAYFYTETFITWNKSEDRLELDCTFTTDDGTSSADLDPEGTE